MSNNNNSTSGGIGFTGLLTIVFIVLKLLDKIDWSWWWVLSPLWIPVGLIIAGLVVYIPYALWKRKDARNRIRAGYSEYGWKKEGRSKWQQRLDEMKKAQDLRSK